MQIILERGKHIDTRTRAWKKSSKDTVGRQDDEGIPWEITVQFFTGAYLALNFGKIVLDNPE